MAQVTVEQLAETVGAPVERLLAQMKDAGCRTSEAAEAVSDEDKKTLLAFLKRSHGEVDDAGRRRSR
jgi:translation initiation factor IF-2